MRGCRRRGSPVATSGNARYHQRELPGSGNRCCGLAYMKRGIKEKRPPRTVIVAVAVENHHRRRRVVAAGAVDTTSRVGGRSDETTRN